MPGSASYKVVVQMAPGAAPGSTAERYAIEREALDPVGAEIVEVDAPDEAAFIAAARDADAVIARYRAITAAVVEGLERAVVIANVGVGVDQIDVAAASARGIVVTNVPDVFVEEVADHGMALLLGSYRRLRLMHRLTADGRWDDGRPLFDDVARIWGQTLGLVSFGNIATAMARRAQAFGMHVIAHDPFVSELVMTGQGVEPVTTLAELLSRADYVSQHAPLNRETERMLGAEQFAQMKPGAVFVNVGRGRTVDEPALIAALQSGQIAAAGLDVFYDEPVDPANPLLHMDNVLVTPHVASATSRMMPEARRRMGREIATVLGGRWPRSAVNPDVLPRTKLRRWQPMRGGA